MRSGVVEFVHENGIMPACKRYQLSQFIFCYGNMIYSTCKKPKATFGETMFFISARIFYILLHFIGH